MEKYIDPSAKRLTETAYWLVLLLGGLGILIAINQTFNWNPFGFILIGNAYYYLLIAIFLALAFLIFPAVKRHADHIPFYDWILFVLTLITSLYLSYHGVEMVERSWDIEAPPLPTIAAGIIYALTLSVYNRCLSIKTPWGFPQLA